MLGGAHQLPLIVVQLGGVLFTELLLQRRLHTSGEDGGEATMLASAPECGCT